MSNFAELNARRVISSASVVGYMRATMIVKPTIHVYISANFVGIL